MQHSDIITGDRIISLCDFVIITEQILHFHHNIQTFIAPQNIILVKDFKTIDAKAINTLCQYFDRFATENKTKQIKLFIYTHILEDFIKYLLDGLDKKYEYIVYLHNSDHHFTDDHIRLLDAKHITKVFSQNINFSYIHPKLSFLPIGLANSMWEHGDVDALYKTISSISSLKKTKNLYVNINSNTFYYRKNILDVINESKNYDVVLVSTSFKEYLYNLSEYRFCLCVRGNGVDTHRFWESLYLGVIPVIINNQYTNMKNYIQYLNKINVPFFEITENNLDVITQKYPDSFFNEDLYSIFSRKLSKPINSLDALKISFYQ